MIGENLEVADLFGFNKKSSAKPKEYSSVESDSFKTKVGEYNMEKDKGYGKVNKVSGDKIGAGITALGVVLPVVAPLPVMAGIGKVVSYKIDNVKFSKGELPTIQPKKRGKIW